MKVTTDLRPATEMGQVHASFTWICETCQVTGVILPTQLESQDAWRVMHIAEQSHRQAAPGCKSINIFPAPTVRTIDPAIIRKANEMIARGEARRLISGLIMQIEKNGGSMQRGYGILKLQRARLYLLKTESD